MPSRIATLYIKIFFSSFFTGEVPHVLSVLFKIKQENEDNLTIERGTRQYINKFKTIRRLSSVAFPNLVGLSLLKICKAQTLKRTYSIGKNEPCKK